MIQGFKSFISGAFSCQLECSDTASVPGVKDLIFPSLFTVYAKPRVLWIRLNPVDLSESFGKQ